MADKYPKYGAGKALDPDDKVLWKEIETGVWALSRHISGGVELVDENGDAYGVKQIDNKPRVSAMPYLYDIAEGNVANHETFRGLGYNADVGTSWETVHVAGGIRDYLTVAERLQIVSTDADDDGSPAGNGARTVKVVGLDADWKEYDETITMNGTTNVTTANSFIRVFYLEVVTAGATGANEGTITASNNADTTVLETMTIGENKSHSAVYTIPVGHVGYLVQFTAFEASSKGSRLAGWIRLQGGIWTLEREIVLLDSGVVVPLPVPMQIPEKTDLEWRAEAVLAGAVVTGSFEGWIEHA